MTNRNKLIVGAVVLVGAYYLYDRSRKTKAVEELKAQAEQPEKMSTPIVRTDTGSMRGAPIVVEKM
jgi:hypothetical protein